MSILIREKSNIALLLIFSYFLFIQSSAITDIKNGQFPKIEVVILLSFANIPKLLAGILRLITLRKNQNYKFYEFKKKDFFIYATIIILEFSTQIFYIIHKRIIQGEDNPLYLDLCLKGFQIYFISGLGFFILHYRFETHKKFGLAMLLMRFCLTLFLNQFFSNEYDPKIQLYAVLYQIAVNITDGVQEVLEKYLPTFFNNFIPCKDFLTRLSYVVFCFT